MRNNWKQEDWRNWLASCDVGKDVQWRVASRFDSFREEIGRAWRFSLGMACVGSTAAVLVLGWYLREPYLYWNAVIFLALIANAAAFAIWLAAYLLIGTSQPALHQGLLDAIASECGEATLDTCSRILSNRQDSISREIRETSESVETLVRGVLQSQFQRLSLSDVEHHFLVKFGGAKFVESGEKDIQIFFTDDRCERCSAQLRSSEVRRLAIEPLRAQSAGLERSDAVLPRSLEFYFLGTSVQFESFFQRQQTSTESMLARMGGLDFKFCSSCSEMGQASKILHKRPLLIVDPPVEEIREEKD